MRTYEKIISFKVLFTLFVLCLLLLAKDCFAQNARFDGVVQARSGFPAPGAKIAVCNQPCTVPANVSISNLPSPLTPLCSSASDVACISPNPITADGLGNYNGYVVPGKYTVVFFGSGLTARTQVDQIFPCDPSNCSLSSVTLSGNLLVGGTLGVTGAGPGGIGTAAGGSVNIQKPVSSGAIFGWRMVDAHGDTNAQLLGANVEQMVNWSVPITTQNSAYTGELFIPIGNTQNVTGNQIAADFAVVNYGSGTWSGNVGAGIVGEAWNAGPATSILEMDGVAGGCHNGSTSAGIPVQTPTGNGSISACRGVTGSVSNTSTGTITNAAVLYANTPTNTGGGTITNGYGLFVADQTAASNNWAISTGLGKVHFGGAVDAASTAAITGNVGVGTGGLLSSVGLFVSSNALTSTFQFGAEITPTTSSAATSDGIGLVVRADTAAASFTQTLNAGIDITTPTVGAGSSITNWNGLRIEKAPTAGTACSINLAGSTSGLTCINPAAVASGTITFPAATGTVDLLEVAQTFTGTKLFTLYGTATNCSSAAGTCVAAPAGAVTIAAAASTVTVATTAVTANSDITLTRNDALSTRLSVTCNTATAAGDIKVSTITPGTSFVITVQNAPAVNPLCLTYSIVN